MSAWTGAWQKRTRKGKGLAAACAVLCWTPASARGGTPSQGAQVVVVTGKARIQATVKVRLKPLDSVGSGSTVLTGAKGWVKLLTRGGCVVKVGPGSELELLKSPGGGNCPSLNLKKGFLLVAAPAGRWVHASANGVNSRLVKGRARFAAGPNPRICALDGQVEVKMLVPAAEPIKPAGAPGPSGPKPLPARPPAFQWRSIKNGSCFMAGKVVKPQAEPPPRFPVLVPAVLPEFSLDLRPLMPKRKKTGGRSGSEGPGQVSAAGGSMCLDSGGSGSTAGNVTQGPQPIDKPPPTTRLTVRVTVPGR